MTVGICELTTAVARVVVVIISMRFIAVVAVGVGSTYTEKNKTKQNKVTIGETPRVHPF